MTRDPALIRAACLMLPLVAAAALWIGRRPDKRTAAAALLSTLWNLPSLLLVHLMAARFGWWIFDARGGLFAGMPVDLYVGWAVLWGAIPVLAFPRFPLFAVTAILFGADLALMPLCEPVVRLGRDWLAGEAVALILCLVPAQLLGRWTRDDRALNGRALLQVLCFSGLMLGVLPAAILEVTGRSWAPLLRRPPWQTALVLQALAIPALLGLSAVQEFASRGEGTPVPYNPPRKLVASGVYAYLANPMQLSMVLLTTGWGLALGSLWVACAGPMALAYSVGLATWDEGSDLRARHGEAWDAYRASVRRWWPRARPWHPFPARLYVAETCGACASVRRWIEGRRTIGLLLVAAEDHPSRDLRRITYDACDGSPEEEGVAALARALEHIHLGWAFLGWTIRLPVVRPLIQLVVDASGGGPRLIPRRP